jgi:hypothetical protein
MAPRRRFALSLGALAASGVAGALGCVFHPDPEVDRFACGSAADCGDGYVCVAQRSVQSPGKSFCFKASEVSPEVCNGLDDDKDGIVDGDPTDLGPCETGRLGACARGALACSEGTLTCLAPAPGVEVCNGIDDDCNGHIDDRGDGGLCP